MARLFAASARGCAVFESLGRVTGVCTVVIFTIIEMARPTPSSRQRASARVPLVTPVSYRLTHILPVSHTHNAVLLDHPKRRRARTHALPMSPGPFDPKTYSQVRRVKPAANKGKCLRRATEVNVCRSAIDAVPTSMAETENCYTSVIKQACSFRATRGVYKRAGVQAVYLYFGICERTSVIVHISLTL